MPNPNAILLLLLLTGWTVNAQPATLPPGHYKVRISHQVCEQLAVAFGETRLPRLTLVARPGGQIAQFVATPQPELILDEKLYDLCQSFGPDSLSALAVVLGHELTHFYSRHTDWFGFAQLKKQQPPTPKQAGQTAVLEGEADLQGCFRAFLAGYDGYRVLVPLYRAIYTAYQLPAQMPNYPSREERLRLGGEQAAQARRLGMAFDVGLAFLLMRSYGTAERCFSFLANEFPTKEVLNNAGLCCLLEVASASNRLEMPFRYPFEVETQNRLRPDVHRGELVNRVDLLKRAVAYLKRAVELDEAYSAASVNLAAAYSLLGRPVMAQETINTLENRLRQQKDSLSVNARLMRAIALTEQGQTAAALTEADRSRGAYQWDYNREVISRYSRIHTLPQAQALAEWETLAGHYPEAGRKAPSGSQKDAVFPKSGFPTGVSFSDKLSIPEPHLVRIEGGELPGQAVYRVLLTDARFGIFHSLRTASSPTWPVRPGESEQVVRSRFGDPDRVVPAGNGLAYFCYEKAGLYIGIRNLMVYDWLVITRH